MPESPSHKRLRRPIVEAPDLHDVSWWGVDTPPDWRALAGHVVLLDVFSTADVASRHALDETRRLAKRFARDPVVVLGVHTPRFDGEAAERRVVAELRRCGVTWPVARDVERRLWGRYSIKAWPSRVVVDPDGLLVGTVAGEGHEDLVTRAIAQTLAKHRRANNLAPAERRWRPAPLCDEVSAPTLHALEVVGETLYVAGDGVLVEARRVAPDRYAVERAWSEPFVEPRGLAASSSSLFVADRATHVVRRVDLASGDVTRAAGTGQLGEPFARGGQARQVALRSPWGLAWVGGRLVVAQAGGHQLWRFDDPHVGGARIEPWVGRGTRRRVDGEAAQAAFDSPCGLARDGGVLAVADAGSCAVRLVDAGNGEVVTLAGALPGDRDGPRATARLQHPTDVVCGGGYVFVVDALNDRLRVVTRRATAYRDVGHVSTLCGAHGELERPSAAALDADGRVLVAGAGLVAVDPISGEVTPIDVDGLDG